ncbi:hypothetical protein ABZ990_06660 [Streptomyces sp. NPDC046203]|uniref:hypothetical protein n=1 Tax=Streptomyces sp. NPDC046203 TaxID=3154602 RepID=UPI0034073293
MNRNTDRSMNRNAGGNSRAGGDGNAAMDPYARDGARTALVPVVVAGGRERRPRHGSAYRTPRYGGHR